MKNAQYVIIALIVIGAVYALFTYTQKSTVKVLQTKKQMTVTNKLLIEDVKEGTGSAVVSGDTVVINYQGTLTNGEEFDSSYKRGVPFETAIGVGRVIQGWDEGVVGMKIGGKRKLTIPSDKAYGEQGIPGAIPPNATLIFTVELVGIKGK